MVLTGFTSNFVIRLEESRRRLDDLTEANEKKADSLAAEVKKVQSDEQQNIDSLLRQLKSLQHERGMAKSAEDGGNAAAGGVAERKKELKNKQLKLEQEVSMLQSKNKVEQARFDGTSNHTFIMVLRLC